jgi:plastocyanin
MGSPVSIFATRGLLALALIFALGACSDNAPPEEDSDAPPAVEDNVVDVDLQEWAVVPDQTTAPVGEVIINIQNIGEETHEFVVVRTDLGFRDLPTVADGSVDEEGEGIEAVDEVEDIASGTTEELTVDLDAGSYVFFCNVVEEDKGETESHYQNGMSVAFVVE